MLWGVVLFFLVMSIPAFFLAQRNRDSLMDAMAMHERLQRTDPDDPLAAVGPTEFQRAYERAVRKRGGALLNWVVVGFFAGLFLGIPIAMAIAWAFDSVDLFGWLATIAIFAFFLGGIWVGASRRKNVYDVMRQILQAS
ncbi:hypothetical protein [Maricaulis sp.]|uniref:hypothetical protein n=1 Tax=Maricaulis sp. TaxID=1486257 RepID=UPI003A908DA5